MSDQQTHAIHAECTEALHAGLGAVSKKIGVPVDVLLRDAAWSIVRYERLLGPLLQTLSEEWPRETQDKTSGTEDSGWRSWKRS